MNNQPTNQPTNGNYKKYFQLSLISLALISVQQAVQATEALQQIDVVEEGDTNATEGSKSYTIKSMNTATGLKIAAKDTPQSVSVNIT